MSWSERICAASQEGPGGFVACSTGGYFLTANQEKCLNQADERQWQPTARPGMRGVAIQQFNLKQPGEILETVANHPLNSKVMRMVFAQGRIGIVGIALTQAIIVVVFLLTQRSAPVTCLEFSDEGPSSRRQHVRWRDWYRRGNGERGRWLRRSFDRG
jgi:hypothetical protein